MSTPRKLALKRLPTSDLTFFKRYHDSVKDTRINQKGITLNADVLIGTLYPHFPDDGTIVVQLFIQGPGLTSPSQLLTRKIIKQAKNWRLNGEIVHDPESGDVDCYVGLKPDDLVLMEFFDDSAGLPARVSLTLISQASAADEAPFKALNAHLGSKSMIALTPATLAGIVAGYLPALHPIETFLPTDDLPLELLAAGVAVDLEPEHAQEPVPGPVAPLRPGSPRTYSPPDYNKAVTRSGRRVTADALDKAKKAQTANGNAGEELVNDYFVAHPELGTFEWSSKINVLSRYDFRRTDVPDGECIDIKTSSEPFEAPFHMSLYELLEAAHAPEPYYIYRVYDVRSQPRMRVSGDITALAKKILDGCGNFETGVVPDGFSLYPGFQVSGLNFGDEIPLGADEE